MNKEAKLNDEELKKCIDELQGSDILNALCILDWINITRNENTNLKQALNEIRKKIEKFNLGKYDYSVPIFELQEILDKANIKE